MDNINDELNKPLSNISQYTLGEKLGEGTFGVVYLGTHILTNERVAIKIIEKRKLRNEKDKKRLEREISILKKLHHINIINLYTTIETINQIYIIQEYASGKELFDYIIQKKKLSEKESLKYFQQIISGIEYIHKLRICHRDLKSENIILTLNNEIKLIDFGLSNFYNKNQLLKTPCGSPLYAAPELLKGKKYSGLKIDIWSCGIILYLMVTGNLPFNDNNEISLFKQIIKGKYFIPSFVSKNCSDLIKKMLITNPLKRITLNEIKEHSWFKNDINDNYHYGIDLNKEIIPIDEGIIDLMNDMNFNKQEVRENILRDEHNNITTTYYLLLRRMVRRGKESISDLISDDYENYRNDVNNLMEKYHFDIDEVVKERSSSKGKLNEIPFKSYIKRVNKNEINNNNNNVNMNSNLIDNCKIYFQKSDSNILERNQSEKYKKNNNDNIHILSHSVTKKTNMRFFKTLSEKIVILKKENEKRKEIVKKNKSLIKKSKPNNIRINNNSIDNSINERNSSLKKKQKRLNNSNIETHLNKHKSQIIFYKTINNDNKNERKKSLKHIKSSYSIKKNNNILKNTLDKSSLIDKSKSEGKIKNIKSNSAIKTKPNFDNYNILIKKNHSLKKSYNTINYNKNIKPEKLLYSDKKTNKKDINKSLTGKNSEFQKIINKNEICKKNYNQIIKINNFNLNDNNINLNQKITNQNNDSYKLYQINENDLKCNLIQFSLFNLFFKSKNLIKDQLIQILNSWRIKYRIDKKNQFKLICEKNLIIEFEVNIINSFITEISILKFKLIKGMMNQYNEIIEKICIKLNN